MPPAPIRPRFTLDVPGDADALIERVRSAVDDPSRRLVCRVVDRHVDITPVREERKRWSPCLSLEFERGGEDEGVVRVRGLVGPHPNVWTMYALSAIALVFLVVTALIVAYAQHAIGESPSSALWWSGGFTGMLAGMYGVSQVGRRLAREQTSELMAFMEETLSAPSGDADMFA